MKKNLWRYDKSNRPPTPQAKVTMYIVFSALCSVMIFFFIFMLARHVYGQVPKSLTNLSLFVIIGVPISIIVYNYTLSVSPMGIIPAYSFYLDASDELWMFDYNATAFENYYDKHTLPEKATMFDRKFGGNHKERTLAFCLANNAVEEIIKEPPYDSYAHHIISVDQITEHGKYLRVQFKCRSGISGKDYPGGIAIPRDMENLDELRHVFESKVNDSSNLQPKDHNEPGVMQIDSIFEGKDDVAILYGIMERGTLTRGDRVTYADESHEPIFTCKIAHIYKNGREIVWATPGDEEDDLGYEFHIKGQTADNFAIGNFLLTKN
ncbi:MAG: hypothetical protein AB7D36_04830 [Oscillospiraceae bacterium]